MAVKEIKSRADLEGLTKGEVIKLKIDASACSSNKKGYWVYEKKDGKKKQLVLLYRQDEANDWRVRIDPTNDKGQGNNYTITQVEWKEPINSAEELRLLNTNWKEVYY